MKNRSFDIYIIVAILALSTTCAAQPSTAIFFDDFYYSNTTPPTLAGPTAHQIRVGDVDHNNSSSPNPLFGKSPWCISISSSGCNSQSPPQRGWYRYEWREGMIADLETGHASGEINTNTNWPGTLSFTHPQGSPQGILPQIASGFTATSGVWAASVNFSSLPPPQPSGGLPQLIQAFWIMAPFQAITTPNPLIPIVESSHSKARFEIDFEWNNWFGSNTYQATSADNNRFVATSIFDNSIETIGTNGGSITPPYSLRETTWSGYEGTPYETQQLPHPEHNRCRYRTPSDVANGLVWQHGSIEQCSNMIANINTTLPDLNPIFLFIRHDGERIKFELVSHGWGGVLLMESDWTNPSSIPLTPQEMMILFSTGLKGSLNQPETMTVDWTYYSEYPYLSSNDVINDVVWLRSKQIVRANTTSLPIERPYEINPNANSSVEVLRATEPLSIAITSGPSTLSSYQTAPITAILSRRFVDYRIKWQIARYTDNNGVLVNSPLTTQNGTSGMRYNLTMPDMTKKRCIQVEVVAVRLDWNADTTQNPNLVHYTENPGSNGFHRATAAWWVCKPGFSPPEIPGGGDAVLQTASITTLASISPNPTSSIGTVRYELVDTGYVLVAIYDVLGREVIRLSDGHAEAGSYETEVDFSILPSGIYVVRLQTGSTVLTQRVTVSR